MRRLSLAAAFGSSALLVAVFAGLEAVLRSSYPLPPASPDADARRLAYMGNIDRLSRPLYRIESINGQSWLGMTNKNGESRRYPVQKPPDVRRVLFVGESSGQLLGAAAKNLVGKKYGRLELFNAAQGGGSLEQVRKRMIEGLRSDPDVVVLMFGHNLFLRYPASARVYRWGLWVRRSVVLSRIVDYFFPDGTAPSEGERQRLFGDFLHDEASELRRRRVRLVLCTLPANLRFPPSETAADRDDPSFRRIVLWHDAGKRPQARDALARLLDSRPTAQRHYTLARWLLEERDYQGALRHFTAARDMDGAHDRASSAINRLIRDAAAREGSNLLDFDDMISASAPHGIPGWEAFVDNQHVNSRILDSEARALVGVLHGFWPGMAIPLKDISAPPMSEPYPLSDPYPQYVAPRIEAADGRWAESLVDYFEQALLEASNNSRPLDSASVSYRFDVNGDAVGWSRGLAPLSAAEAEWRSGNAAQALLFSAMAVRAAPLWSEIPYRRGVYQLSLGRRDEARKSFLQALALDHERADAAAMLNEISYPRSLGAPARRGH